MADFFDDGKDIGEEEDDIITLHNEINDCDEDYYHLATLDYLGKWYIVLKPVEHLEDIADDEVLIFELVQEKDEAFFKGIEDDDILAGVLNEFNNLVKECECEHYCEGCNSRDCEGCEYEDELDSSNDDSSDADN